MGLTAPVLASARLRFHPFTADDLPLLRDLHSDAEVQTYLEPDGVRWDEAVLREKLALYRSDFADHGWAKMAVFDQDGRFVGRAGFGRFDTGELELGYTFRRECWGRGYATEAGAALLEWIYRIAPIDHVIAFAMTANAASIAALRKLGMTRMDDRIIHGAPHALFRHDRP